MSDANGRRTLSVSASVSGTAWAVPVVTVE
jgi:hypothetical protein